MRNLEIENHTPADATSRSEVYIGSMRPGMRLVEVNWRETNGSSFVHRVQWPDTVAGHKEVAKDVSTLLCRGVSRDDIRVLYVTVADFEYGIDVRLK